MSSIPGPANALSLSSSSSAASFLPHDLFNNPVFAGGIGLAGLGASAAFARRLFIGAAALLRRRLLVSLEVSKQDASYPWLLAWLTIPRPSTSRLETALSRVHHLSIQTSTSTSSSAAATKASVGAGASSAGGPLHAHFRLQPGYGRYIIRHGGAYIQVQREKQSSASLDGREPHETLTLTTLYAHRHVFEDVFAAAHALAARAREGRTLVYTSRGTEWAPFGDARRKRPLASVALHAGVREQIVADVEDFLASRAWYTDRGVPYRRGYLLHGPPGTGKSSFIEALAGHLDFDIAIINLSERGLTDDRLAYLLMKLPRRTILLLEDADAAWVNRTRAAEDGYGGGRVTFSGLLNALDGVAAGEERICFLTTNHIERLDPALVRPGRVDLTVEFPEANAYQAECLFTRFYPMASPTQCARFIDELKRADVLYEVKSSTADGQPDRPRMSAAAIQALCLLHKDDPEAVIASATQMFAFDGQPRTASLQNDGA